MAMVDAGLIAFPSPVLAFSGNPNFILDAASEVVAGIVPIYKTGSISHIHWRTGTVTTGSSSIDVRVETINTSGQPSGTLWGTTTNGTQNVNNTDDNVWFRTALTSTASVTKGDKIALVIANPAASFANMQIKSVIGWPQANTGTNYGANPNRTTKTASGVLAVPEYDDGTVGFGFSGIQLFATNLILTTSTNPDEVSLTFTAPCPMRVCGWYAGIATAAGADYRMSLYESGNNTPLLTQDLDGDLTSSTGSMAHYGFFSSNYTLITGTVYRISLIPLTTNNVTLHYLEGPFSHTFVNDVLGMRNSQYASRNRSSTTDPDSASWTNSNDRHPMLGVLVDQLADG